MNFHVIIWNEFSRTNLISIEFSTSKDNFKWIFTSTHNLKWIFTSRHNFKWIFTSKQNFKWIFYFKYNLKYIFTWLLFFVKTKIQINLLIFSCHNTDANRFIWLTCQNTKLKSIFWISPVKKEIRIEKNILSNL